MKYSYLRLWSVSLAIEDELQETTSIALLILTPADVSRSTLFIPEFEFAAGRGGVLQWPVW